MNGIDDIGADANGVLQAAVSDINLKNTIENSPFGLNEILLLNPVTFLYNDENRKIDSDVKEVGFIAQDVFDVIPNAVSSTGTGDLQLNYRAITATLAKAIQEQQALIKALEQRLLILENK
jgi:trimeric autotransporter adhesin